MTLYVKEAGFRGAPANELLSKQHPGRRDANQTNNEPVTNPI